MSAVERDRRVAADEASVVDRIPDGRTLVVASNREPYSHEYDGGDADRDAVDGSDRVAVPPVSARDDLRRLLLDDDLLDGRYHGYSSRVPWPLGHSLPSKIDFEEQYWRGYRRANERFATTVVEEADTDDPLSEDALAELYRHADAAIVSPLRDRPNLVAKEYVAAQVDDDGALQLPPDERGARTGVTRERVHEANGSTRIAGLLAPLERSIETGATAGGRERVRAE